MGRGTSPETEARIKVKAEMADYLKELHSTDYISYKAYDVLFDFSLELLDKMYQLGKEHGKN